MKGIDFISRCFDQKAGTDHEMVEVKKLSKSDWCHISIITDLERTAGITLRSQQDLEQLHFMLGRLLGK